MPKTQRQISFDVNKNRIESSLQRTLNKEDVNWKKVYRDIEKHMSGYDFDHIGYSVYVSRKPMTYARATEIVSELFDKHPYMVDCFDNIQNTSSNKKKSDITSIGTSEYRAIYDETTKDIEKESPTETTDNKIDKSTSAESNTDIEL